MESIWSDDGRSISVDNCTFSGIDKMDGIPYLQKEKLLNNIALGIMRLLTNLAF